MVRKAQPRTGTHLICKRPECGSSYYATPSRAKKSAESGGGYCSYTCAYGDRKSERGICPECEEQTVKHPNVYCGQPCYQAAARRQRQEERTARLKERVSDEYVGFDAGRLEKDRIGAVSDV